MVIWKCSWHWDTEHECLVFQTKSLHLHDLYSHGQIHNVLTDNTFNHSHKYSQLIEKVATYTCAICGFSYPFDEVLLGIARPSREG